MSDQPPVRSLVRLVLGNWLVTAGLASAGMLGAAHAFETFGGLLPCHLCFVQRDVYWVAASVAALGLVLTSRRVDWAKRTATILLALIFLTGAGIAAYHAGVEWKWWPGPSSCSGGGAVNAGDISRFLAGDKARAPQCDQAAWVWLGLSMAGWNCLISLGLAGLSGLAVRRGRQSSR